MALPREVMEHAFRLISTGDPFEQIAHEVLEKLSGTKSFLKKPHPEPTFHVFE